MDFTILIDTREQRPLCFGALPTRRACLHTGDYSIEGSADTVGIERKSLPDLFACIGQQRDRLMSWSVPGRLPVFFCGDRRLAAMTVSKLLEKCAKHITDESREGRAKQCSNSVN